jgi:hypothetical protein
VWQAWALWQQCWYYDELALSQPSHNSARIVKIVAHPETGRPYLVEGSAYNPTGGGKATYLATSLGSALA